jgi:prepilin-type N-terminal cleavage/methylation domain-containing protein
MKSKGFTLIELAVVLAIIAVLAAVLTPMVTGYLDQARIARAQADTRTASDAVKLYRRDTGQWPVYASATDQGHNQCCGIGADTLIGGNTGSTPGNGTATWNASTVIATTNSLEVYLNGNLTSVSTANAFPKARFAGPYIGSLDSDPWGNRYILTAANLATSGNHAYVISAGPNGVLDTTLNQVSTGLFTVGGDDVVSLIQ